MLSCTALQVNTAEVIQAVLMVTGLSTILHILFGTRLPLVQGSSLVYLAPALAIASSPDVASIADASEVRHPTLSPASCSDCSRAEDGVRHRRRTRSAHPSLLALQPSPTIFYQVISSAKLALLVLLCLCFAALQQYDARADGSGHMFLPCPASAGLFRIHGTAH